MNGLQPLRIQRVARSRRPDVDYAGLGFGNVFSDHMFSMRFDDGEWRAPEIVPYGPIQLEPGCLTLHYGQSVFEGLKVFRGLDGRFRMFRPDRNEARMRASCERLCIPAPPANLLPEAIAALLTLDHAWVPEERGQSLYVRPIVFADESHLEVRPATSYRLLILTAPARTYYANGFSAVALKVQDEYTRAAPGGTGFAKTAGNYAASLLPGHQSRAEGFDQALWLDGAEHRYVEEVGQMNIFFHLDDRVVTPELRGTILPGVTRDSVIRLLQDSGLTVEERRIPIDEVIAAIESGRLREAFGAGTATVVAPVGRIGYRGHIYDINGQQAGPLSRSLYDQLLGIQVGEVPDPYGWTQIVDIEESAAAAD